MQARAPVSGKRDSERRSRSVAPGVLALRPAPALAQSKQTCSTRRRRIGSAHGKRKHLCIIRERPPLHKAQDRQKSLSVAVFVRCREVVQFEFEPYSSLQVVRGLVRLVKQGFEVDGRVSGEQAIDKLDGGRRAGDGRPAADTRENVLQDQQG